MPFIVTDKQVFINSDYIVSLTMESKLNWEWTSASTKKGYWTLKAKMVDGEEHLVTKFGAIHALEVLKLPDRAAEEQELALEEQANGGPFLAEVYEFETSKTPDLTDRDPIEFDEMDESGVSAFWLQRKAGKEQERGE